jgi:hypothetical protein
MGGRDKGGREARKPKKDAKKPIISASGVILPPAEVEVVRKKRKEE